MKVPGEQDDMGPARRDALGINAADVGGLLNFQAKEAWRLDPARANRVLEAKIKTGGMDANLIDANLDEVERDMAAVGFNADLYRNSPKIAKWYAESPYHMAIVRDPEAQKALGSLERIFYRKDDLTRPLSEEEKARTKQRRFKARLSQAEALAVGMAGGTSRFTAPRQLSGEEKIKLKADAAEQLKLKIDQEVDEEEQFVADTGKVGLADTFRGPQTGPLGMLKRLPFMGSVFEAVENGTLYEAAKAAEAGSATPEQLDLLLTFGRVNAAYERRGQNFLGKAADIVAGSLKLGTEFGAASGIKETIQNGIKAAALGGVKRAALYESMRQGEKLAAMGGMKAVGKGGKALTLQAGSSLAGIAGQAAAIQTAQTAIGVLQRMSPQTAITADEKTGEMKVNVTGPGKSFVASLPYAAADAFIEVFSEHLGGALGAGAATLFPKSRAAKLLFGGWGKTKAGAGQPYSAFVQTLKKGGIDGVISEMGEEEWGKFLKDVVSDAPDYKLPLTPGGTTGEELLAQAAAFGIPAFGGAMASGMRNRALAEQTFKAVTQAGVKFDALEKAGVPLEIRRDIAERVTKGTQAEFAYLPVEEVERVYNQTKGVDGQPIPLSEVLGPEYLDAKAEGRPTMKVRTSEFLTNPTFTEKKQDLGKVVTFSPTEMSQREAEVYREALDKDQSRLEEAGKKADEVVKAKEAEIEAEALEMTKGELSERERVTRETDLIAQLRADFGDKGIYWPTGDVNAEELTKSGFPKNLMADVEKAKTKGYAIPVDEAAAKYGMSDTEFVEAVAKANQQRKALAEERKSGKASDRFRQAVTDKVRARALREATGEAKADLERSAAAVQAQIHKMLSDAGFDPVVADAKAELYAAFFRTMGGRVGKDPMELFQRTGLTIVNKGLEGPSPVSRKERVYNQESPQERVIQGFYHRVQKLIEDKMPNRAPVDQVRGLIKDLKAEEREWSEIDEYLADKQTVEKEELLSYLKVNQLVLQEVRKGEQDPMLGAAIMEESVSERLKVTAKMAKDLMHGKFISAIRKKDLYATYQKDEIPHEEFAARHGLTEEFEAYKNSVEEWVKAVDRHRKAGDKLDNIRRRYEHPKYETYTLGGGRELMDYREFLAILPDRFVDGEYQHNHWSEQNVLGHLRFGLRNEKGGKDPVLMVEEVQSDWHQAGREKGYRSDSNKIDTSKWTVKRHAHPNDDGTVIIHVLDEFGEKVAGYRFDRGDDKPYTDETAIKLAVEGLKDSDERVPDAPFKKTWHEFLLKRVIRHAAEHGIERLAWTTGSQQNKRYNLADTVDSLTWRRSLRGGYSLFGHKDDVRVFEKHDLAEEDLPQYVGKEVAEKLLSQKAEDEGLDVKSYTLKLDKSQEVGGSGMRGFYDQMIPAFLNKFGKKYGAQVGEGEVVTKRAQGIDQVVTNPEHLELIHAAFINMHREDATINAEETLWGLAENLGYSRDITEKVHTFPITPALRKAAMEEGFSYFQTKRKEAGGDGEVLGRTLVKNEGKLAIELFKGHNLSTVLHEGGHAFLEIFLNLAGEKDAPDDVKADAKALLDWMGVKNRKDIRTPHHEALAEAFTEYLERGKAPSQRLQSAFNRFRAWLSYLYQKYVKGKLEIPLTPEITAVFDRMLATNEEIELAQAEAGYKTLEGVIPMEEQEAAQYSSAVQRVMEEAQGKLGSKMTRDVIKAQRAFEKSELDKFRREESEVLANTQGVFAARTMLRNNTFPGGERLETPPLKLRTSDLPEDLRRDKRLIGMHAEDGNLPLEEAAERFGYDSGAALLQAILETPKLGALAEKAARDRFNQQYGEPMSDAEIAEHAQDALHNEMRSDLLLLELEKFAKLSGKKVPPLAVLRNYAKRKVGDTVVGHIRPDEYQKMSRQAAAESYKAAVQGEYDKAFEWKEKELLANEMYRESVERRDKALDIAEYMSKFRKQAVLESLGKAGPEYIGQIQEIMDRFGFRPKSDKKIARTQKLRDFVKSQQDAGIPIDIPDDVLDEARRIHYKEMTSDALEGMYDSVRSIENGARLKNRLLRSARKREFDEAMNHATASMLEVAKKYKLKEKPADEREPRLRRYEIKRALSEAFAIHTKFSNYLRQLDGWESGGAMWELLGRGMNEAADNEARMRHEANKAITGLFDVYSAEDMLEMEKKRVIPGTNISLTKRGILSVALNVGNEDSLRKLQSSEKWDDETLEKVLDTLDKRDWDFVQSVWDYIDTYWDQIRDLHERVTGLPAVKVDRQPVETKYGTYPGGYYPLKYDNLRDPKSAQKDEEEVANGKLRAAMRTASTKHAHRKERMKWEGRPLRLDLGVIAQHVAEVIHDLTHYEYVVDAMRTLNDERIEGTIRKFYGYEAYNEMVKTVIDVAQGDTPPQDGFEKAMGWLRSGTTVASMGFNATTALLQLTGVTQSMVRVGPTWFLKAIGKLVGGASRMENAAAEVYQKSEFMRQRARTQVREINEIRNAVKGQSKLGLYADLAGEKLGVGKISRVTEGYFYLISKVQQLVDVPTWIAAYEKAKAESKPLEEGETAEERDKTYVAMADQAVRDSQGGGQLGDLASIQRGGPLRKIWTTFYSYMNVTFNQTREAFKKADWSNPKDIARFAADFLMLYNIPAALSFLVYEAMGRNDKDKRKFKVRLGTDQLAYMMGTLVGVRELQGLMREGSWAYEGPAGTRFFASAFKAGQQTKQLFEDGESAADEALFKAWMNTGGILFHAPTTQLQRTADGIAELINGRSVNPLKIVTGD